jgi:hypothetical protein
VLAKIPAQVCRRGRYDDGGAEWKVSGFVRVRLVLVKNSCEMGEGERRGEAVSKMQMSRTGASGFAEAAAPSESHFAAG